MNRREFIKTAAASSFARAAPHSGKFERSCSALYEIGTYYFPNWHVDPLNEKTHGRGWTEWRLVQRAEPKFQGHQQPKVPEWGYENEADAAVFAKKIDAAANHAINYFIFDWYWFNGKPFLNGALDHGYLGATNRGRLKFCLMWANQNWVNLHPARLHMPYQTLFVESVDSAQFEAITTHIIAHYFSIPTYWKVDGAPYFSIYDLKSFLKGLGGINKAKRSLDRFREKVVMSGHSGLHVNAVDYGIHNAVGNDDMRAARNLVSQLGVDSVTSYTWIHNASFRGFPTTSYSHIYRQALAYWQRAAHGYGVAYFPNVSMGWDSSPRGCQSDVYTLAKYPFLPIVIGNSPAEFRSALESVREELDLQEMEPKIFNINAWNEWTEGSYLEPDTIHRFQYLEAIRKVFRA